MTPTDKPKFQALYSQMMQFYRVPVDPSISEVWWRLCEDVDFHAFDRAVVVALKTQRFCPQLADILDLIRVEKWPTPEAAWNEVPKTEAEAGWLCDETAAALGACSDSLDRGDTIAARKAFIETYERILRTVTGEPRWWISEASVGDYESRLALKGALLEQHPIRRPKMLDQARHLLAAMNGLPRTGQGLSRLSDHSAFTTRAKMISQG